MKHLSMIFGWTALLLPIFAGVSDHGVTASKLAYAGIFAVVAVAFAVLSLRSRP